MVFCYLLNNKGTEYWRIKYLTLLRKYVVCDTLGLFDVIIYILYVMLIVLYSFLSSLISRSFSFPKMKLQMYFFRLQVLWNKAWSWLCWLRSTMDGRGRRSRSRRSWSWAGWAKHSRNLTRIGEWRDWWKEIWTNDDLQNSAFLL